MLIVAYISGHGFGHASRDLELIKALHAKCPGARVIIRTEVHQWFFETAPTSVDVQTLKTDTGVAQIDSLHIDTEETARRAAAFYRNFEQRADEEAGRLAAERANLVIGDIPPLAFAAASHAKIRSVAVGNFTWDWIYQGFPVFEHLAPNVVAMIAAAYATATRALRLPLHGGFESMARVTDIPFIARRSSRDPVRTRHILGVPADKPLVLASFGAYGAALPLDALTQQRAFTLLTFDRPPNGLLYQDIVAAADVVVSKPGYGIVSECVANDTALLYTSRGNFAEYDVFVQEMPRYLRCRHIAQTDFFAGRWESAIDALLQQRKPLARARVDGADVAADEILDG
jgi:L-arabinokinase